jgi:hypothetical protein
MTVRRLITLSAATAALASAGSVIAHPGASPGHAQAEDGETIVYRGEPVVQPLPAPHSPPPPPAYEAFEHETHTIVHDEPAHGYPAPSAYGHAGSFPAGSAVQIPPHGIGGYPYAPPHAATHYPAPARFDRDAWLADCRERIRGVDREDRGGVIGGLLGAVAGGVIGNRSWDRERLAGTLLGAGVGGLAGIAIGSAIGAAGERRREDECAWHLDRYVDAGHGYPGSGYGYGYGYPAFAYVPVLVQVPQRAVVREYVTEEWIDEPVRARSVPRAKIIRQPATPAGKPSKLIKVK